MNAFSDCFKKAIAVRLDAYLKKSHLIKRRELASGLCEEGMVRVNGHPRKAAHDVKVGDEVEFPLFSRHLKVRVLGLPEGNAPKSDQWSFFEVLEEKRIPLDMGLMEDPLAPHGKPPRSH